MGKYLDSNGLSHLISKIKTALGLKQDTLVSGTNIKTVNGNSLLGSGNLTVGSAAPVFITFANLCSDTWHYNTIGSLAGAEGFYTTGIITYHDIITATQSAEPAAFINRLEDISPLTVGNQNGIARFDLYIEPGVPNDVDSSHPVTTEHLHVLMTDTDVHTYQETVEYDYYRYTAIDGDFGDWEYDSKYGEVIPIANGGTNATTASAARTNLDVPGLNAANRFMNNSQFIKLSGVDTSLANNGVSAVDYHNFGIIDKNERYLLFCQSGAMTDGSVRAEFSARNYGTGANVSNMVRLIVDNSGNKDVYLSAPEAWRAQLGMSVWPSDTSGTNNSGTFLRGDGVWSAILYNILSLRDSSIDRDAASVTADDWGDRYLRLQDKDGETIGAVRCVQRNGGRMDVMLIVYNEDTDGTQRENIIRAGVAKDGTCSYGLSDPAAFRSALALNTWTTVALSDFATAASGWSFSTNNCNVQYNAALGALRVRIQIQTSAAQTAGQKTLFTVKTAYRPKTFAASISSLTSYAQAGQIYTTGGFAVNIVAIGANTNLYFNGVYFIGA